MKTCYYCNGVYNLKVIWTATKPILHSPMCLPCRLRHKKRFGWLYFFTKNGAAKRLVTFYLS